MKSALETAPLTLNPLMVDIIPQDLFMYRIYSYKLSNLSQISREVDVNINYTCLLGISKFQSIHDDELNAKITRWYSYCLRVKSTVSQS